MNKTIFVIVFVSISILLLKYLLLMVKKFLVTDLLYNKVVALIKFQFKQTFPLKINIKIRKTKYILNFYIFNMVLILLMYS